MKDTVSYVAISDVIFAIVSELASLEVVFKKGKGIVVFAVVFIVDAVVSE